MAHRSRSPVRQTLPTQDNPLSQPFNAQRFQQIKNALEKYNSPGVLASGCTPIHLSETVDYSTEKLEFHLSSKHIANIFALFALFSQATGLHDLRLEYTNPTTYAGEGHGPTEFTLILPTEHKLQQRNQRLRTRLYIFGAVFLVALGFWLATFSQQFQPGGAWFSP